MDGLWKNETGAREPDPKGAVSLETVKKTLPYLTPTVAAMVRVQFLCGMRPQDVCNIRPVDIDRTESIWIYRPQEHKNSHRGQTLMKAIPVSAQKILVEFWPDKEDSFFFSPKRCMEQIGRQDLSRYRDRYVSSAYYHAVRDACVRANSERWSPNQLRHTMATYLRARFDQETAQYYLGHRNISTTDIYAHRSEIRLREVATSVDDLI